MRLAARVDKVWGCMANKGAGMASMMELICGGGGLQRSEGAELTADHGLCKRREHEHRQGRQPVGHRVHIAQQQQLITQQRRRGLLRYAPQQHLHLPAAGEPAPLAPPCPSPWDPPADAARKATPCLTPLCSRSSSRELVNTLLDRRSRLLVTFLQAMLLHLP